MKRILLCQAGLLLLATAVGCCCNDYGHPMAYGPGPGPAPGCGLSFQVSGNLHCDKDDCFLEELFCCDDDDGCVAPCLSTPAGLPPAGCIVPGMMPAPLTAGLPVPPCGPVCGPVCSPGVPPGPMVPGGFVQGQVISSQPHMPAPQPYMPAPQPYMQAPQTYAAPQTFGPAPPVMSYPPAAAPGCPTGQCGPQHHYAPTYPQLDAMASPQYYGGLIEGQVVEGVPSTPPGIGPSMDVDPRMMYPVQPAPDPMPVPQSQPMQPMQPGSSPATAQPMPMNGNQPPVPMPPNGTTSLRDARNQQWVPVRL